MVFGTGKSVFDNTSNIPQQQFISICYSLLLFLEGETAAVSVQYQPASKQSVVFIYRRDGAGFGGGGCSVWVFSLFSFPIGECREENTFFLYCSWYFSP